MIRDKWGDHSIVCNHKGDKTRRHSEVRDLIGRAAAEAGMNPKLEEANLLPGRWGEDGAPMLASRGAGSNALQRPADVYAPRRVSLTHKGPAALDMAVTSGLRYDKMRKTIRKHKETLHDYEQIKDE